MCSQPCQPVLLLVNLESTFLSIFNRLSRATLFKLDYMVKKIPRCPSKNKLAVDSRYCSISESACRLLAVDIGTWKITTLTTHKICKITNLGEGASGLGSHGGPHSHHWALQHVWLWLRFYGHQFFWHVCEHPPSWCRAAQWSQIGECDRSFFTFANMKHHHEAPRKACP